MSSAVRRLDRVRTLPAPSPGQFGPDHRAVEVIAPGEWAKSDPFILMMDDRVDGTLRAGPHPHAGFETVTFVVEGDDMPSEHRGVPPLGPADVEWTTAGSGIVHGPDRPIEGRMRVLQLWLALPEAERWTAPDHQFIRASEAPTHRSGGVVARLYSGSTGDLTSRTRNRVPVTLVDLALAPGATHTQTLGDDTNGFLYVLEGEVRVGPDAQSLAPSQVGWLDDERASGTLTITNASSSPARVLFYAGQRQRMPIVSYGPFIGGSREDIQRSFERYRAGTFLRV